MNKNKWDNLLNTKISDTDKEATIRDLFIVLLIAAIPFIGLIAVLIIIVKYRFSNKEKVYSRFKIKYKEKNKNE